MSEKSTFEVLSAIDTTDKLKKKDKMDYLPWSSAWAIVKEHFPDASYRVNKTPDGCIYHTDGKTCWVEVSVTISGETQTEILAVMNHRNADISADTVTATATNKSIKRCLVKCLGLFGLGLSLWNGEELSDAAKVAKKQKQEADAAAETERKKAEAVLAAENAKIVELCKQKIEAGVDRDALYAVVKKYAGKNNPNAISTIEESKACFSEINAMKA